MFLVGGTYILFSGLVYLVFLMAWLGFHLLFAYTWYMRVGIALVIIGIGIFSLKDYIKSFRGVSLRIPDSVKPRLFQKMRTLLQEGTSLPLMLLGVASLAVTVNLVELLCTAGLPAAFTRVLAEQHLPSLTYYTHLIVYIIFYMIDELLLLIGFVITFTAFRVSEKYGRVSRLIAGLVMIGLGLIMLLQPDLLTLT
jgi:hypothetical protein